ncbi:MAG TPA: PQQ-binding-like beta-propeller repeat protein [Candidatus Baltobacteraceae bacterium]|jgi:outer membrane protein assembly factor BamB|nr:PQQ-binding-like beta-propeller repeat protein [Candidatus Baltobacteraceae bacterium]
MSRLHWLLVCAVAVFSWHADAALGGDWPQWLGPRRDGHAAADSPALEKLSPDLKVVWRKKIGGGFSSPVVAGGKLVYFDENSQAEVAHLLDASTGAEIWSAAIGDVYRDEWGAGPRSTPVMDGDRVFVQSCKGEFRCLNLADGRVIWGVSFARDFGVKFLGSKSNEGTAARRGNNGSPLVDDDAVIVPVGATNGATLVCFEKSNGRMLWKAGNDEAAYSSPVVATLAGVKQIVAFTADNLMGVERKQGTVLWQVPFRTEANRNAATPVIFGDTVIVNSHTIGLVGTRIVQEGGAIRAVPLWANQGQKINLSTPVRVGDYLYSQGPGQTYICADARTGETKWEAAWFGARGTENTSTIAIGNHLLALTDMGELVLVAADPHQYTELSRVQVCGKNWNFPACANGRIYVRDARELICYELLP